MNNKVKKSQLQTDYLCNICNKFYASQSSLCHHNKKFHNNNILKSSDNILKSSDNILKSSDNILKSYNCRKCNKTFKNIKTRWSHEKICKITNNNENINTIIEAKLDEFKNNILDILQKNAKIHPKTLQKINKELNNNNIINNITNNNTTNNNNTINTINNTTVNIKFGNEKISNLLNEKEMLKIVNKCRYSVEESIKLVRQK
jgi:hypothetical protein